VLEIQKDITAEVAENAECSVRTAVRTEHLFCELCGLRGEPVFFSPLSQLNAYQIAGAFANSTALRA